MNQTNLAQRAIALLDLTSLEESDDDAKITALCARAETPFGSVAAICVYTRFVSLARRNLKSEIRVASVANFPHGNATRDTVAAEIRAALAAGADEIDVVFPYPAFLAGDRTEPRLLVAAAREAVGTKTLKVILETGRLGTIELIREAGEIAVAAGADFLKTSTGKTQPAATPEAARALLEVISSAPRPIGFKAAGGIRTLRDAATYISLADEIMGTSWARPTSFRLGASALLDDLLTHLGQGAALPASESRY